MNLKHSSELMVHTCNIFTSITIILQKDMKIMYLHLSGKPALWWHNYM